MTDDKAHTPQQLLAQIRSFVEVSKTHVERGGEVDMSGLDDKVRELCEAVLDMPKAEADDYTVALHELANDLTHIKNEMEAIQRDVRQQLDTLNLQQKAAKAYSTNEAKTAPPKGSKDESNRP